MIPPVMERDVWLANPLTTRMGHLGLTSIFRVTGAGRQRFEDGTVCIDLSPDAWPFLIEVGDLWTTDVPDLARSTCNQQDLSVPI